MAATLTDELTRVSVADIEKWDEGPDGTVYVYGRCTTPEVDTDDRGGRQRLVWAGVEGVPGHRPDSSRAT